METTIAMIKILGFVLFGFNKKKNYFYVLFVFFNCVQTACFEENDKYFTVHFLKLLVLMHNWENVNYLK